MHALTYVHVKTMPPIGHLDFSTANVFVLAIDTGIGSTRRWRRVYYKRQGP
ncbi:hypothetical protein K450DRAFT_233421 [Umbelopsis ramanniana AG]|uniref:Uncharacterized protein n=1 Tax=Umbelopsis ramanniana AG TaxID=1314678 RepID=A0AAD5ECH7_UMBRA|nr:uncharacterized protein K450DRAFT_233421 [Umbelopsis ramanniana AG]KAI8581168.1 hypothetical protein K450DRAFT_233421 [Umbelopsis ramanniana AG]